MSIFAKIIGALESLVHRHRPMTQEEVTQALTQAAATREETTKEHLDWQTSVVDLLKLLDLDSGFQARRALAEELGMSATFIGSVDQNKELHALVMESVGMRCTSIPKA